MGVFWGVFWLFVCLLGGGLFVCWWFVCLLVAVIARNTAGDVIEHRGHVNTAGVRSAGDVIEHRVTGLLYSL